MPEQQRLRARFDGSTLVVLVPAGEGFEERRAAIPSAIGELEDVGERYLDALDDLDDEIERIETMLDADEIAQVAPRASDVRRRIIEVRRALTQTRDAVHEALTALAGDDERRLRAIYDELLQATETAGFVHDLAAATRDYYHVKIAERQNDVVKRLTAIASLLLVPTLIVGVYGQNFKDMPELGWSFGYWWSWGLILVTTVAQLAYFRRKDWL